MSVVMKQADTTRPTEECVDHDLRLPASRQTPSALSALSELFLSGTGLLAGRVSRVFTRVCLLAKHQPRWIGRLFPLALLLASTVLMGAVPVHAGTTISDYGNGSCVDDDHWVKAKTDPNWTCQINIEGLGGWEAFPRKHLITPTTTS